jgi:sugar O-acyltransferase (sialic acid O-acetyltransferase NeuD family)
MRSLPSRIRVIIAGAGGHGKAVAEILSNSERYTVAGFLDDMVERNSSVMGFPVVGSLTSTVPQSLGIARHAIVAIGNNQTRQSAQTRLEQAGFEIISVVHPSAYVSGSAVIGRGCAIMACAAIGTEAILGDGVIVNTGAVVDHHCRADHFSHLGTNAAMAGGSSLGCRAWMQAGAALGYGVVLADNEILLPGESRTAS